MTANATAGPQSSCGPAGHPEPYDLELTVNQTDPTVLWQHLVQWQPATAAALAQHIRTLPDDWPLRVFGVGRPDAALTLPPGATGEQFPDRAPEIAPYDEIAPLDDCPACTEVESTCRWHEGYAAGHHEAVQAQLDAVRANPTMGLREFMQWQADVDEAEDRGEEPPEQPAAVSAVVSPPTDRAAWLTEAADIAESLRQFEPTFGARKAAQISENVGILRVAEHLRRLAAEAHSAGAQQQPDTEALTAEELAHALDNSTPYPIELDGALCRFMAERLLEMTTAHKRPEHAVWQPDEELPADQPAPIDPATLAPAPVAQQPAAEHTGGNAEDCPACIEGGLNTLGYPWECPGPEQQPAAADGEKHSCAASGCSGEPGPEGA